ncbi:MAG: TIGR02206 family membrane protein [Verrucomicrobiota bacterium]
MKFELFGAAHWTILGLTFATAVILIGVAKKWNDPLRLIEKFLACVLILTKLATVYIAQSDGTLTLQNGLPMHLCDWANIIVIVVLFWPHQLLYEIAYYWGIAGTIQALLTPDLRYFFPDPRFMTFFVSHIGIIVSVFFLTLGRGMRPTKFSLWKVFVVTQFYIVVTLLTNWALDANYGYFCAKPKNPSLLDYLGAWPYYIFSMDVLALVFFFLCYAPFFISKFAQNIRRQ